MNKENNLWKYAFVFVVCVSIVFSGSVAKAEKEIVFFNWGEYMDPSLIKDFESKFKVRVKEVFYESDELKDEMLVESNGEGYDVVLGSGISLIPYLSRNWLESITSDEIPNLKHIDPRWSNAHPELKGYAAPHLWGFLGIAYRKDLVKQDINSWKQLFRPEESLRGKILLINDSRDTIGPALKALGYSLNTADFSHYKAAEKLLLSLKPFVKEFTYPVLTKESALVTGEILMATLYNGDAITLQEYDPNIVLAVPDEGAPLWVDYLVVMRSSKNKKLAKAFINFLHEPRNASRLSEYLMFATTNKSAEKYLSKEHLGNPYIYPSDEALKKSEIDRVLAPRIVRKRNSIFAKLVR